MAKFKKGDRVVSIVNDHKFVYLVQKHKGGGWYKIRGAEPSQADLQYTVRGCILKLVTPPNIDDRELEKDIYSAAAILGRRGGKKSRRKLSKAQAKRMVQARENKKLDRKQMR